MFPNRHSDKTLVVDRRRTDMPAKDADDVNMEYRTASTSPKAVTKGPRVTPALSVPFLVHHLTLAHKEQKVGTPPLAIYRLWSLRTSESDNLGGRAA